MKLALCPTITTGQGLKPVSPFLGLSVHFFNLLLPLDCYWTPLFPYFLRMERAACPSLPGEPKFSISIFPLCPLTLTSKPKVPVMATVTGKKMRKKDIKWCFWPRKKCRGHLHHPQHPCQVALELQLTWCPYCQGAHCFLRPSFYFGAVCLFGKASSCWPKICVIQLFTLWL